MSLVKRIGLKMQDYTINLSTPLKLYKCDVVTLIFKLEEFGYEVRTEPRTGMTFRIAKETPINPLSGILLIETEDGRESIESAEVNENEITFKLTEDQTLALGVSKMQIVLEGVEEHRKALPEFEFEVKDTIVDYHLLHDGETIVTFSGDTIVTDNGDRIIIT